jgi:hypothetical protein
VPASAAASPIQETFMSILIACPSCGARLNVSDNAAGKTVQCLKCGARMDIPPPPAPPPAQADPPPAAATSSKQQISAKLRQYEEEKNQEEYEAPVRTPRRHRGRYEETDPEYESDEEYHEVPARTRRPQRQSNWMAITGMIMGLVSIGFGCIPCGWFLGFLPSILGIIFSGVGLAQALQVKTKPQPGKKMAITGLVTSILALVILPVIHLLILGAILSDASDNAAKRFEKNLRKEMDRIQKQIDRDIKKLEEEIDKDIKDFEKGINNPIISNPGGSTGKSQSQNQTPPTKKLVFKAGQRDELDGISMTVLDVQATSKLNLAFSDITAQPGRIFLIVDIQIENKGRNSIHIHPIHFNIYVGNAAYAAQNYSTKDAMQQGILARGASRRGKIVFMVPENASNYVLSYEIRGVGNLRINLN